MLKPVSKDVISLKLLEAVESGLNKDSPLPLIQSMSLLRNDIHIVVEVLNGLGFVIAQEVPDEQ